jgi:hypothetical protein
MELAVEVEAHKHAARNIGSWLPQVGGARTYALRRGCAWAGGETEGKGVSPNLLLNSEGKRGAVNAEIHAID